MRARGSVLVAVLWCLALLSLVVVGALHTSRMDLMVVRHHGDRIQAHYLALAGIEKAKALLYHDARERSRSGRNHTGDLYNAPEHFRDVRFGRGLFRVIRGGRPAEGGGLVYGIEDEESRLNVNTASSEELGKLRGMTPDVVAAMVDWRDEDNAATPGGAETEYYAAMQPPSLARNGPVQSIRELLMVRGVTRSALLGDDLQLNGLLPPTGDGPEDGAGNPGPDASSDLGWAASLTAHSSVANLNAAGQSRINLQSADEATLTSVRGITPAIAQAILASRGQNRLETLADLLDVSAAPDANAFPPGVALPANVAAPGLPPPPGEAVQPPSRPAGPRVVDENLLLEIADDLTTQSEETLAGPLNLNTADVEVLACLPGLNRERAQAIVGYRKSSGFLPNIAWLLRVPGINAEAFKEVASRVTVRSETFRILSEGQIPSTRVRVRIEAVVHIGLRDAMTLAYREDDL